MAHQQTSSSQKALMLELKSLQEEPVEGFRITLVDESDLYNWEVAIFGPPNTHYEGGYFKVRPRVKVRHGSQQECVDCGRWTGGRGGCGEGKSLGEARTLSQSIGAGIRYFLV